MNRQQVVVVLLGALMLLPLFLAPVMRVSCHKEKQWDMVIPAGQHTAQFQLVEVCK